MRAALRLPPIAKVMCLCAAAAIGGCGGDEKKPPVVQHESAASQVKRVATRWGDTIEETGFLQNDPNGVLELRVVTTRALTLGDGATASMHVERDEVFTTKAGRFHCKAKGDLAGSATYAWEAGEAAVRVDLGAGSLPRACEQGGFPVAAKVFGATALRLVLQSDRLVSRGASRDRVVLLPLQ